MMSVICVAASMLIGLLAFQVIAGDVSLTVAQSGGASGGQVQSTRPNAAYCSQCFKKLQQDNRDCESLQGQDWTICRKAADVAYRQCSKGC